MEPTNLIKESSEFIIREYLLQPTEDGNAQMDLLIRLPVMGKVSEVSLIDPEQPNCNQKCKQEEDDQCDIWMLSEGSTSRDNIIRSFIKIRLGTYHKMKMKIFSL